MQLFTAYDRPHFLKIKKSSRSNAARRRIFPLVSSQKQKNRRSGFFDHSFAAGMASGRSQAGVWLISD
jgi:hypothetical protein